MGDGINTSTGNSFDYERLRVDYTDAEIRQSRALMYERMGFKGLKAFHADWDKKLEELAPLMREIEERSEALRLQCRSANKAREEAFEKLMRGEKEHA